MSLTAMAHEANRRYAPPGAPPRAEVPAGQPSETDQTVADAIKYLMKYIPTEVLGAYIPAIAAIAALGWQQWALFWFFLAATPVLTWLLFAQLAHQGGKALPISPRSWPIWSLIAGPIAFAAYASALPGSVFHNFKWFTDGVAVVTVFVAVVILYAGSIIDGLFQAPSSQRVDQETG